MRATSAREVPMKLKWLALFALVTARHLSAQNSSPPSPPSAPVVRVAFWNIQWFPGRHPNASTVAEQRQIAAVQRDMRAIDFTPISAWVEMWKHNGALLPPRGFAFAVYEIAPRHLLLVYALHLKSNRGEPSEDRAIREESIRQLRAHIAAMNAAYGKLGTTTWIIGGDFNTSPDDPRFAQETTTRRLLADGFSWCWRNVPFSQRITLPADKFFPSACFDHIFFRNATLVSARVIPTSKRSSDHRAIFGAFQLPP